jgi:hypothetical protein
VRKAHAPHIETAIVVREIQKGPALYSSWETGPRLVVRSPFARHPAPHTVPAGRAGNRQDLHRVLRTARRAVAPLTFTRNADWHHWLCAIAPSRKAVRLLVHKGALLTDARGVLKGDGRYLRAITFCSPDDVDADVVVPILREAAARQTEM